MIRIDFRNGSNFGAIVVFFEAKSKAIGIGCSQSQKTLHFPQTSASKGAI
jgi:hypothetical protein